MNGSAPSGVVITVSNQAEFEAAYESLKNGEGGTILLDAASTYALASTDSLNTTDAPITISSADPANPAEITSVRLTGAENLTFEGIHFHMDGDDEVHDDVMIRLTDSTNVVFRDSVMTSNANGPLGTTADVSEGAQMALVRDSSGVTFEGNYIAGFNHGVTFRDSYDGAFVNNEMTELQGDGIRLAGVSGMLIEGNHLHDFHGSTQEANHSDMIQIWGTNIQVNNENITIRENFLDTGNGANYQMIYGDNKMFDENGFTFSDILIEGNVLFGAHSNAISLGSTDYATVRYNTVIYNTDSYDVMADGSTQKPPHENRIKIDGTNTLIEHNISQRVIDGTDNALLSTDSYSQDNDYRSHFINVEAGGSGDLRDLMLRPDSELNGKSGSWLSWSTDTADTVTAVADVSVSQTDRSFVTLDAGLSRGPDGYVEAQGAEFTWIFDDGTTASGAEVTHDFLVAGKHSYDLIVTMPDGTSDRISRTIEIESPIAAKVVFEGDEMANLAPGAGPLTLRDDPVIADGWLEISERGRLEISRETQGLFNMSEFNIGLTADIAPGADGTLLELPRTFKAVVEEDGHLKITLTTQEGTFSLRSDSAIFADNGAHTINIVYDSTAQTLSLMVDDVEDSSTEAYGITPPKAYWGLTVGGTWRDGVDAKVKDIYVLTEAISVEEAEAATAPLGEGDSWSLSAGSGDNGLTTLSYDLSDAAMVTEHGFDLALGTLALTEQSDVFHGAETFNIAFDAMLDEAGATGTVLFMHNVMELSFDEFGRLLWKLNTDEGWVQIASEPLGLEPGDMHQISLTYDGTAGSMQMLLDGEIVAEGTHTGTTSDSDLWAMHFGHPWAEETTPVTVDHIVVQDWAELATEQPSEETEPQEEEEGQQEEESPAIAGDTLIHLDFEGDEVTDLSGAGVEISRYGENAVLAQDEDMGSQVLQVSNNSSVRVDRGYDAMYELNDFVFDLNLQSDTADGRKVFGIHKSFELRIEDNDLVFTLTTSEGKFTVESTGDIMADQDWHNVQVAYSDELDQLQLVVDGTTVDSVEASGTTLEREHWGLDLGRRWGDGFDGSIDDFVMMTNVDQQYFDAA